MPLTMPHLSMAHGAHDSFRPVELQPFIHQVGGHTSMFRFNETTVCKPMCSREYKFYTSLPPELGQFTPEFKGNIKVQLCEDSVGNTAVVAYPMESSIKKADDGNNGLTSHESSNSQAQSCTDNRSLKESHSFFADIEADGVGHAESLNPWSLKCHKKQLAKMREDNQQPDDYKFILLENVVAPFSCPSIVDLKMGTRQHGDDVPESKKKRHTQKCEQTTSAAIGLRVCGMQVYQTISGKYICHNKYYGRSLKVDGFKQALHQFLHNGQCLRHDVLDLIIHKLRQLYTVVQKHNTFRFYSSSLLIMYDGLENRTQVVDVLTAPSVPPSTSSSAPSTSAGSRATDADNATSVPSSQTPAGNDINHNHRSSSADLNKVDVRMIDFAHSTHKDFVEDRDKHSGPDGGYLFGLGNLIKLFEELRQS